VADVDVGAGRERREDGVGVEVRVSARRVRREARASRRRPPARMHALRTNVCQTRHPCQLACNYAGIFHPWLAWKSFKGESLEAYMGSLNSLMPRISRMQWSQFGRLGLPSGPTNSAPVRGAKL
jgi:hypothetical protein